ncbi:MAG: hypothetical protein HN417_08965 [Desulfobacula sp.]|nr:hypothetical protein [Desulfobacula sp.]
MATYIRFEDNHQVEMAKFEIRPDNNWFEAPEDFDSGKEYILKDGKMQELSQKEIQARDMQERKTALISEIKQAAGQKVEELLPVWKQLNVLMEAVDNLAANKPLDKDVLEALKTVRKIRTHSDKLEGKVMKADDPEKIDISFDGM